MKVPLLALILAVVFGGMYVLGSYKPQSHAFSFSGTPSTEAQLGELLFFDTRLSADYSQSCASCHIPEHAFADTLAFSLGVHNKPGKRNAPSCMNMAGRDLLFYDGRARDLEDQVHFPIEDPLEMATVMRTVVRRLQADAAYRKYFQNIYHSRPTKQNVATAIAAFERTLETGHTPFDRYMAGDTNAMPQAAIRGRELFMSPKAKCFDCHFSPDFTGDEFRNIGLFDGASLNDSGRYLITHRAEDIGSFKVPGLRNVAVTAPYMHNGMFATLREVIDYYDDPTRKVAHPVNMDTLLQRPLHLTPQEKSDLETFLNSLTDDRFKKTLQSRSGAAI